MKKFLTILAIAGSLVACNENAGSSENVKDSVIKNLDSAGEAKVDSIQDSIERKKEAVEATFEKTDSANKAISDSANK